MHSITCRGCIRATRQPLPGGWSTAHRAAGMQRAAHNPGPHHRQHHTLPVAQPHKEQRHAVWINLKDRTLSAVLHSVAQSCPALCEPMDGSSPGSSVGVILQARIPKWVAMPCSRGSSQPSEVSRHKRTMLSDSVTHP